MRLPVLIAVSLIALGGCRKADVDVIADASADSLNRATDLGFNPEADELWIVNKADDSVTILNAPGTRDQTSEHIIDPYALHFMEKVTSIAFGAPDTFATCQDGRNTYNDAASPNDFTGPTLWSSDREIFGTSNPEAVDYVSELFGGPSDLGSHLDMLHESPQCMGIAWETGNAYWVFDGFHGDIVRYDFNEDHGVGYDDHCDGDIQRWEVGVTRSVGIVSHLAFDASSGMLYIADTGADRVVALDTTVGSRGTTLPSVEESPCQAFYQKSGPDHYTWEGGELVELVTGIGRPSGLALFQDQLFVAEHATGLIHVYDLTGDEVDVIDTELGAGALQGLEIVEEDTLWAVNGRDDTVVRIRW